MIAALAVRTAAQLHREMLLQFHALTRPQRSPIRQRIAEALHRVGQSQMHECDAMRMRRAAISLSPSPQPANSCARVRRAAGISREATGLGDESSVQRA